ncbi:hypothetical protein [Azomonas macrocytogenes]|uniref:Uncharacterized protein n=1 Tax=Azomonas macrocytogenes TaxID=69962 RepID=A0A839T5N0_AZOMA|nr:hypothetical protein [Azomonas macrocytogenes]MBB3104398.1 hypothetical protein [Azomonas macrocytogenes]
MNELTIKDRMPYRVYLSATTMDLVRNNLLSTPEQNVSGVLESILTGVIVTANLSRPSRSIVNLGGTERHIIHIKPSLLKTVLLMWNYEYQVGDDGSLLVPDYIINDLLHQWALAP